MKTVLYTDPEIIKLVEGLAARGLGRQDIADELQISKTTVRKILVPGYAEAERARGAQFDKVRAPLRRQDPKYQAYKAAAGASEAHKTRVKERARARRAGGTVDAEMTWPTAAKIAAGRPERVTAEETRRAEAGRVRGIIELSLEASIAANVLIRKRGCAWQELIEDLLIEAYTSFLSTPESRATEGVDHAAGPRSSTNGHPRTATDDR